VIEINITESWGDLFYVGLNGVQVIDIHGETVQVDVSNLEANPRDMNSIPGHGSDHRTLDKLVNGVNNTTDDMNMWLIPYNKGEDHTLRIDLGRMVQISGIRFYNYNKTAEDTLRGAKNVIIKLDSKLLTPARGVTLRKAPGFVLPPYEYQKSDIGQTIPLPYGEGWKPEMILPLQKI